MSSEIKIVFEEVKQELSDLKSSANAIDPTFPTSIGGDNVLDVVKKLNTLTLSLQNTITAYKALLVSNEESTRKSVETMDQADQEVAATITQS